MERAAVDGALGRIVLGRGDKLLTVDVTSRTTNTDPAALCSGAITSLRKYILTYQTDVTSAHNGDRKHGVSQANI